MKQATTVKQQIKTLKDRGMSIDLSEDKNKRNIKRHRLFSFGILLLSI